MKLPKVSGLIDRRILINYRLDPDIAQREIPAPFEPLLVHGHAIAGICMIRLKNVRPTCSVPFLSINSENAAHRFAVTWKEDGVKKEGVYIPRRDTSSVINTIAGGTIFPGIHHHAKFEVYECDSRYEVKMTASDSTTIEIAAHVDSNLPANSIFASLADSSRFFEGGCVGYSDTNKPGCYDGLELKVFNWQAEPLQVEKVLSSYFENHARFPPGCIEFDHALLMLALEHEWHALSDLCSSVRA